MENLKQVEKLRERADLSYDEAKRVLEEADGDLLQAIINLEKENRIKPPKGGGYYNSREGHEGRKTEEDFSSAKNQADWDNNSSFKDLVRKFAKFCGRIINKGNRNHFQVIREGERILIIPVTVLVILLIFTFWLTLPAMIVGLFFGLRYEFSGPELGKEEINRAMDSAANAASSIKKEVKGEDRNGDNTSN